MEFDGGKLKAWNGNSIEAPTTSLKEKARLQRRNFFKGYFAGYEYIRRLCNCGKPHILACAMESVAEEDEPTLEEPTPIRGPIAMPPAVEEKMLIEEVQRYTLSNVYWYFSLFFYGYEELNLPAFNPCSY